MRGAVLLVVLLVMVALLGHSGYSVDDTGSTGNGTKPWLGSSDSNNGNQQWVITSVP